MIQFYGYNDARAIAAYNKLNLTKIFLITEQQTILLLCKINIILCRLYYRHRFRNLYVYRV